MAANVMEWLQKINKNYQNFVKQVPNKFRKFLNDRKYVGLLDKDINNYELVY